MGYDGEERDRVNATSQVEFLFDDIDELSATVLKFAKPFELHRDETGSQRAP